MNLVVDKVRELEVITYSRRRRGFQRVRRCVVIERRLAVRIQTGADEQVFDVRLGRAVEDRGRDLDAEVFARGAKVQLQNLTDVHTGGNAERI